MKSRSAVSGLEGKRIWSRPNLSAATGASAVPPRSRPYPGRGRRAEKTCINAADGNTLKKDNSALGLGGHRLAPAECMGEEIKLQTNLCPLQLNFKDVQMIGRACETAEAAEMLNQGIDAQIKDLKNLKSGVLRLEVMLPGGGSALRWLQSQSALLQAELGFYFRQRDESVQASAQETGSDREQCVFSGVGDSWLWKGAEGEVPTSKIFQNIQCYLDGQRPSIRCVGGTRFDCEQAAGKEWAAFGSFMFFIPTVEYHEDSAEDVLACTLVWNAHLKGSGSGQGVGASTVDEAAAQVKSVLRQLSSAPASKAPAPRVQRASVNHIPSEEDCKEIISTVAGSLVSVSPTGDLVRGVEPERAVQEYLESGQQGLDDLLMSLSMSVEIDEGLSVEEGLEQPLSKLVLARKTEIQIHGAADPHSMLQQLQASDANSYQFCLSLPSGEMFLGSSPERLYRRSGRHVATEAVAATRPRGPKGQRPVYMTPIQSRVLAVGNVEKDFLIGLEMLQNPKDHAEFALVRDWLREKMSHICTNVEVEVPKSVIRRANFQHLYGRLSGTMKAAQTDYDVLKALHPTPAVCGQPQRAAKVALSQLERFDRGYYAGPMGWMSGEGAEFTVAIRSGLARHRAAAKQSLALFAGVGIVRESNPEAEWQEMELKVRPFTQMLSPRAAPLVSPNVNVRTAALLIEELCRSGVRTFALAPGSRSSPLVYAAASNPNCQIVPFIDERSLGFWSLGYGRATGRPAPVITSSGTAVGNLLPAVIEASQSRIPMLLLTADRPSKLHGTGANQTIDQIKLFGSYARYFHDVTAPSGSDAVDTMRSILTLADAAVRHACMEPAGPVHLNLQFDEPLAPVQRGPTEISDKLLGHWWHSGHCYTDTMRLNSDNCCPQEALREVLQSERGLLVVGELLSSRDRTAALRIAKSLNWPSIVDVLSGLKCRSADPHSPIILTGDQILRCDKDLWDGLKPSVILQLGGHLTSKRLVQFLEHCRTSSPETVWLQVSPVASRDDPQHLVTHKATLTLSALYSHTNAWKDGCTGLEYLELWQALDSAVGRSLSRSFSLLQHGEDLTEPYVSFILDQMLPNGHGLFLGNGMPIRDMDMFGAVSERTNTSRSVQSIAANRGASGIDGVVSTSMGYALGLRKPVTLLIGDVSFLHDSNGLGFLRNRPWPPMTIVVINNGGGGIFDFLPISQAIPSEMFEALWSTPQFTNIAALCQAYGVPHTRVATPDALGEALSSTWRSNQHGVLEVMTDRSLFYGRANNVALHKELHSTAAAATEKALSLHRGVGQSQRPVIKDMTWTVFSLPLENSTTTEIPQRMREGLCLKITLLSPLGEWTGHGEVSPLTGLHKESLSNALQHLRFLREKLKDREVPPEVCLLNGSLTHWLEDAFGIQDEDLVPSVRFGFDSALISALAALQGCSLHELLSHAPNNAVAVNALLGTQTDKTAAREACWALLARGYRTVKLKVGRTDDPVHDAEVISDISAKFGDRLRIRLDANRAWSLDQALSFAENLSCSSLEYIEEPVAELEDLTEFCVRTELPVALDESLSTCETVLDVAELLRKVPNVACCILKPSCLGSMDRLMQIMQLCSDKKIRVVLSSAFESPVGLAVFAALAGAADSLMSQKCGIQSGSVSHGLGTISWFAPAVLAKATTFLKKPVLSLPLSWTYLRSDLGGWDTADSVIESEAVQEVKTGLGSYAFYYKRVSIPSPTHKPTLLLLHGFLGTCHDWLPMMHYLSHRFDCIAVDLPGHGHTLLTPHTSSDDAMYDFSHVTEALYSFVLSLGIEVHGIVGYSLGGRLGQSLAAMVTPPKLVVVSGSPGIADPAARATRLAQDREAADQLSNRIPFPAFLRRWYEGSPLWTALRSRRQMYRALLAKRELRARPKALAKALVGMSPGRMPLLLSASEMTQTDVQFLYGQLDAKLRQQIRDHSFQSEPLAKCGHGLLDEAGLRLSVILDARL